MGAAILAIALVLAAAARPPVLGLAIPKLELLPRIPAGIPIYAGWPPGWRAQAVAISTHTGPGELADVREGYGPRPDRFDTWRPLRSGKTTADYYLNEWGPRYAFGVVESRDGGTLEFYVLVDGPTRGCCSAAFRGGADLEMGAFSGKIDAWSERVGMSGMPPTGGGWRCVETPRECWKTLERPATGHPTIGEAGWTRPTYKKMEVSL